MKKRCPTGKVRWRDRIAASLALIDIQRRSNRDEKRVYHCSLCKGWHLTSEEPNV